MRQGIFATIAGLAIATCAIAAAASPVTTLAPVGQVPSSGPSIVPSVGPSGYASALPSATPLARRAARTS